MVNSLDSRSNGGGIESGFGQHQGSDGVGRLHSTKQ